MGRIGLPGSKRTASDTSVVELHDLTQGRLAPFAHAVSFLRTEQETIFRHSWKHGLRTQYIKQKHVATLDPHVELPALIQAARTPANVLAYKTTSDGQAS